MLTHFSHMGQFWKWAESCGDGASLFRVLDPFEGAVDALNLLARGHDVVIVTTKPRYDISDTFSWIGEHRLLFAEVHIVDDKTTVGCDVYLDDGDHNLEALVIG